jgi:hypothetical protein
MSFSVLAFSLRASSPTESDSLNAVVRAEKPAEVKPRGWHSTSFYGEFGMPTISHSYAPLVINDSYTYGGGISFNFRFVPWLGMQVGAGLTHQKIKFKLDEYNDQYMTTDSEGDSYQKIISAQNVTEDQTWLWLNVPLSLSYYHELGKIELYGFGGVEMRYALKADFKQIGDFTHQGYYEQWNILFDDLPEVGFYTDRTMVVSGELEPDLLMAPFVGIGILAPGQKGRFYLEARYYLNCKDPFVDKKQATLFSGPANNMSAMSFKNESVMHSGDVSFNGIKIMLGINF